MNLLLVDQFSDPGGAQQCLLDLLPGFLERGWKPRIMVPGSGRLVQAAAEQGIPVHDLPLARYTNGRKTLGDGLRFGVDTCRAALAVRSVLRRHAIDVIYANGPRPLPALAATARPTIFHSHNVIGKQERTVASWALRRARARVVAASRYVADSWAEISGVRVVYTGVRDRLAANAAPRHDSPVCIGIIGRIAPEKGHKDLLAAARCIGETGRRIRVVIYGASLFSGTEYDRSVRRLAEGLDVEFRGWVDDVSAALASVDMVAMPSALHEAAPRVAMEAMSAGVPVVAYRSGGIPELIEDGRSGVLTDAAEPGALAAALVRLIDNPELRASFGTQGRQTWRTRFTLERYRREICELVESAAEVRGASAARWT